MKNIFENIIKTIKNNFNYIHFITLIFVIIISIIVIIFLFIIKRNKEQELKQSIKSKNNLNHLIINLIGKKVYSFSLKKLIKSSTTTLDIFLNQFDDNNKKQLYRWLLSQTNKNSKSEKTLDLLNYNKKDKIYTKDIFICQKNNYETNTIHIDYYKITLGDKNKIPFLIKADYEVERYLYKLRKNTITNIGLISLFYLDEKIQKNICLESIKYQQLVELLLKRCDKNHLIKTTKNNEIILLILNQNNDSKEYLKLILNDIYHFIEINDYKNISFNICIYQNKGQNIDFKDCLEKTYTLRNYLLDDQKYTPDIYYYYEGGNYSCTKKQNIISLIEKAIKRDEFTYQMTPFYSIRTGKLKYYKFDFTPSNNSQLTTEHINSFIQNKTIGKNYLTMIINKINNFFSVNKYSKDEKPRIIISSPIWFLKIFNTSITSIPDYFNYCFILSLNDLEISSQDNDEYLSLLRETKEINTRLCLDITTPNNIKESVLNLIDYISFDGEYIKNTAKDKKLYFLHSNMFTTLSNKKITLIANNVNDLSTLETFISYKIHIIAGKCVENDNKNLLNLSKKITNQVRNIYDKYY